MEKEKGKKNEDHFKPQAEPKGPPPRPKAISKEHEKPQAEPKPEVNKVKVSNPKHLKPQE